MFCIVFMRVCVRFHALKQPRVALLTDPPFDALSCGQIYFLFDYETQLPVQRIRSSALKQTALPKFGQRYGLVDLKEYNVLILPGGGDGLDFIFRNLAKSKKKRDSMLQSISVPHARETR